VGARFSAPVQTGAGAYPVSCAIGTGSFPGVKSGRGVTLTLQPLLVPWSRKSRAIPLLPLWAVWPLQSLSACTRVHFTLRLWLLPWRRLQLKCDGTRWRTGGEVKGKLANGVGSQYPSHYLGTWCIQHYYRWCVRLSVVEWTDAPRRFKWTPPFRRKTKSGFCVRAITFQMASTVFCSVTPCSLVGTYIAK